MNNMCMQYEHKVTISVKLKPGMLFQLQGNTESSWILYYISSTWNRDMGGAGRCEGLVTSYLYNIRPFRKIMQVVTKVSIQNANQLLI